MLGGAFGQRSIDLFSAWSAHSRPTNTEERSTQNRIGGQRHAIHDPILSRLSGITVGFKQLSRHTTLSHTNTNVRSYRNSGITQHRTDEPGRR
ncbi:hypothetical protein D3C77_300420 [compost metagenome]